MFMGSRKFYRIILSILIVSTLLTSPLLFSSAWSATSDPTCGSTITGQVTLHADIGPCPANGLIIGADSTHLNCAGHTITGVVIAPGIPSIGILNTGFKKVVINNCTVTNLFIGIQLVSSSSNVLSGNTASGNAVGIALFSSSSNVLSGNTASGNPGDGFKLDSSSSSNTVDSNTADSNGSFGYEDASSDSRTAGTANTYTGNECSGNGSGGSNPTGLCGPQA